MMGPSSGAPRPDAESVAEAAHEPAQSEVPAVMATPHMARFEFSDAGTKILMVEWLPGDGGSAAAATDAGSGPASSGSATKTAAGAGASATDADTPWQVSWPGKSTFLPARDVEASMAKEQARDKSGADADAMPEAQARRRVYFLLPPDAPVPATVTITPPGQPSIEVKPLPAIFPESFLDAESATGSRGVLHTIWAKKRLSELEREMDAELRANAESVGVEMALAEKQWIVDNFLRPPAQLVASPTAVTPATPRSPITGRLGEKLKGLRLATSPSDLIPSPTGMYMPALSPSLPLSLPLNLSVWYIFADMPCLALPHSQHIHKRRQPVSHALAPRR
jgi:hypothetical protein